MDASLGPMARGEPRLTTSVIGAAAGLVDPVPSERPDRGEQRARAHLSPFPDFTYRVLIAVSIAGLAVLLWFLADVLMLVFGGVVLATALRAMSTALQRIMPLKPGAALFAVVVLVAGIFVAAFWLIGAQLAAQMTQLYQLLPEAFERVRAWVAETQLGAAISELAGPNLQPGAALTGVRTVVTSTLGALASALLIIFIALYIAADPSLYRRGLIAVVPHAARARLGVALDASGEALARWLVGQFIAMLGVGLITFIGLWLLGVPLAFSLALIAGLLEFIPLAGPIVAAVPAVLVAFAQGGPLPLYVLLLYLAVQQIEGNLVMPLVQSWAVALPPVLAIVGVVMFGLLFGPLGVLFATPLMVVLMVFVQRIYVDRAIEDKPIRRQG